jgi:hypothetical protein
VFITFDLSDVSATLSCSGRCTLCHARRKASPHQPAVGGGHGRRKGRIASEVGKIVLSWQQVITMSSFHLLLYISESCDMVKKKLGKLNNETKNTEN